MIIFYAPCGTLYLSGSLLYSVNIASYVRHGCNKDAICDCNFHFVAITHSHEVL